MPTSHLIRIQFCLFFWTFTQIAYGSLGCFNAHQVESSVHLAPDRPAGGKAEELSRLRQINKIDLARQFQTTEANFSREDFETRARIVVQALPKFHDTFGAIQYWTATSINHELKKANKSSLQTLFYGPSGERLDITPFTEDFQKRFGSDWLKVAAYAAAGEVFYYESSAEFSETTANQFGEFYHPSTLRMKLNLQNTPAAKLKFFKQLVQKNIGLFVDIKPKKDSTYSSDADSFQVFLQSLSTEEKPLSSEEDQLLFFLSKILKLSLQELDEQVLQFTDYIRPAIYSADLASIGSTTHTQNSETGMINILKAVHKAVRQLDNTKNPFSIRELYDPTYGYPEKLLNDQRGETFTLNEFFKIYTGNSLEMEDDQAVALLDRYMNDVVLRESSMDTAGDLPLKKQPLVFCSLKSIGAITTFTLETSAKLISGRLHLRRDLKEEWPIHEVVSHVQEAPLFINGKLVSPQTFLGNVAWELLLQNSREASESIKPFFNPDHADFDPRLVYEVLQRYLRPEDVDFAEQIKYFNAKIGFVPFRLFVDLDNEIKQIVKEVLKDPRLESNGLKDGKLLRESFEVWYQHHRVVLKRADSKQILALTKAAYKMEVSPAIIEQTFNKIFNNLDPISITAYLTLKNHGLDGLRNLGEILQIQEELKAKLHWFFEHSIRETSSSYRLSQTLYNGTQITTSKSKWTRIGKRLFIGAKVKATIEIDRDNSTSMTVKIYYEDKKIDQWPFSEDFPYSKSGSLSDKMQQKLGRLTPESPRKPIVPENEMVIHPPRKNNSSRRPWPP